LLIIGNNLTTNKSNFSTEYNSNTVYAKMTNKSNTNLNKISQINDFQICEEKTWKTIENIYTTNLQDISHILIDNKDTFDEYINTNQFDLLTEVSARGNNLMNSKDNNELFENYNKIEYDDILEDCWMNMSK